MNVTLQKYGPPVAVIAIALYLGWPPEAPMDLGDDLVRAKSVRWKVTDLEAPPLPPTNDENPFAKVLVKAQPLATVDSSESAPEEPSGPTEEDLQTGLRLDGIAKTDQHQWAIVNRRVCRVGDQVPVIGLVGVSAEIREISTDHITVVVGQLKVKIRQLERKRQPTKTAATSTEPTKASILPEGTDDPQDDNETEDEAEDEDEDAVPSKSKTEGERSGGDPTEQFFPDATQSGRSGGSGGTG